MADCDSTTRDDAIDLLCRVALAALNDEPMPADDGSIAWAVETARETNL